MKKVHIILIIFGGLSLLTAIIIFGWFIYLVSQNHEISPDFNPAITQTIGVFIGGVVPVFLSITTIILIYLTYSTNREELNKFNEFNNQQQFDSTFNSIYAVVADILGSYNHDLKDNFTNTIEYINTILLEKAILRGDNEKIKNQCNLIIFQVLDQTQNNSITTLNNSRRKVKIAISAIIKIYDFLKKSNPEVREFHKFRIDQLLNEPNALNVLKLNGLVNPDLKRVIEENGLLSSLDSKIVQFKYNEESWDMDYQQINKEKFNFELEFHYKKSAFIKD